MVIFLIVVALVVLLIIFLRRRKRERKRQMENPFAEQFTVALCPKCQCEIQVPVSLGPVHVTCTHCGWGFRYQASAAAPEPESAQSAASVAVAPPVNELAAYCVGGRLHAPLPTEKDGAAAKRLGDIAVWIGSFIARAMDPAGVLRSQKPDLAQMEMTCGADGVQFQLYGADAGEKTPLTCTYNEVLNAEGEAPIRLSDADARRVEAMALSHLVDLRGDAWMLDGRIELVL